jgi:hypothetical protein
VFNSFVKQFEKGDLEMLSAECMEKQISGNKVFPETNNGPAIHTKSAEGLGMNAETNLHEQSIQKLLQDHTNRKFKIIRVSDGLLHVKKMNVSKRKTWTYTWALNSIAKVNGDSTYILNRLYNKSEQEKLVDALIKHFGRVSTATIHTVNSTEQIMNDMRTNNLLPSTYQKINISEIYKELNHRTRYNSLPTTNILTEENELKIRQFIEWLILSPLYKDYAMGVLLKINSEIDEFTASASDDLRVKNIDFPILFMPMNFQKLFPAKINIQNYKDLLLPLMKDKEPDAYLFSIDSEGKIALTYDYVKRSLVYLKKHYLRQDFTFLNLKVSRFKSNTNDGGSTSV